MNQITPNLWFNDQAEQAVALYKSTFDNVNVRHTTYYTDTGKEIHGHNAGDVMTVEFDIFGQRFVGLNGGPAFTFTPAISFFVHCTTKGQVQDIWQKLADGGSILMALGEYPFSKQYGWLNDKFGVSWQIGLAEPAQAEPKIVTSLLFVGEQCGKAEEAMRFYASVFPQSNIGSISRYPAGSQPDKQGTVMYGEFSLMGQQFTAMDSAHAHDFTFNEAVSLMVECATQDEIDNYWQKLSAVPQAEQCGWLKDKYGVSWQIAPTVLNEMLQNGTPQQVERVTNTFLRMKKFDITELGKAYKD